MNNLFKNSLPPTTDRYRIVAIDDSYQKTGRIYAKVQVIGTSRTFDRSIADLYQKEWLEYFAKEDVAHIGALYAAEQTNNLYLVKDMHLTTAATKSSVITIGILFTAMLILSNLTGFKLAHIYSFNFSAGLIFFPLTYVFDDILTEVYGFKISRRIIWMALFANLIVFLGSWLTVYLPPSPYWHYQSAYSIIYEGIPRIFLASICGYVCGEFLNSIVLAKLKILTSGNHLWLRAIASTTIGVGVDTILFTHIAFIDTVPYHELWKIIITMYLFKVAYEICAVPITYWVSNYLKIADHFDHYDVKRNLIHSH